MLHPRPRQRPSLYVVDQLLAQAMVHLSDTAEIPRRIPARSHPTFVSQNARESLQPRPPHRDDSRVAPTNTERAKSVVVQPEQEGDILVLHMNGQEQEYRISYNYCHRNWAQEYFGDEAKYWDNDQQFSLKKQDSQWFVQPNRYAVNDTLHNAKKITSLTRLRSGDAIAVGKEIKGIVKTICRVSFRRST